MNRKVVADTEGEVVITLGESVTIVKNGHPEAEFAAGDYRDAGKCVGKMISDTLEWMAGEGNWRLECKFTRR